MSSNINQAKLESVSFEYLNGFWYDSYKLVLSCFSHPLVIKNGVVYSANWKYC